jgi:hypothetical protein
MPLGPLPFPLYAVPMRVGFDPPEVLFESVAGALGGPR